MKACLAKFCHKKEKIAVIELRGVIGNVGLSKQGINIEIVNKLLENVEKLSSLKAIALVINSPGGAPAQAEIIAKRIRAFAARKKLPIISFVEDVAASGGYWLACVGEEIFVSETSIVGSIGVIVRNFGFVEAIKKLGIERRVYTEGENKNILDPFMPEKESDIEILTSVQKDIYESFKEYVRSRRSNLREDKDLFSGRFWSGKASVELGLVDAIGEMQETMKARYGEKIEFCYLTKEKNKILKLLGLRAEKESLIEEFFHKLEEISWFGKFGL